MKVSNDALTERVYSNPLYNVYTSMKKTLLYKIYYRVRKLRRKGNKGLRRMA